MDDFTSRTADHMLDYMGSDGDPGWVFFRQFGEGECLYSLERDSVCRSNPGPGLPLCAGLSKGTSLEAFAAADRRLPVAVNGLNPDATVSRAWRPIAGKIGA